MRRILLTLLIITFSVAWVSGQSVPEMTVNLLSSHESIAAGESVDLFAELSIPEKHHLTENFLEIRLNPLKGFDVGFQQVTSGEFEKGEVIRRGKAVIKLPLDISAEVTPGEYTLKGATTYQLCREVEPETCFPPVDKTFSVTLTVLPAGEKAVSVAAARALGQQFTQTDAIGGNAGMADKLLIALEDRSVSAVLFALLIVFAAGFLTSLTPCVYPMIPITISYIGGRSAGQGKLRGFILSLFYVLGLALVYSGLGVFAGMTGTLFGSATQSPGVVGFVALIFGVMGLSMLGLFDIQLPAGLQSKMQGGGPKSGYLGAVSMGAVAGLVAAPCAGPVIVALVTFIAQTQSAFLGFILMMGFALGMGILFIILGTFSGLLSSLPSAGMWMDKVKKVFGIIMLGAALYIAKPLMSPPVYGVLIGMGMVLLGSALGAFRSIQETDPRKKDLIKGCAIVMVVWGVFSVVNLVPIPGRIIPDQMAVTSMGSGEQAEEIWRQDLENALEDAKNANKMVILDFGAEWCPACKELEHITFQDPVVVKRLKEMVAVKVDCTKSREPEIKAVQEKYSVTGLPTVIVLDSEGFEIGRFVSFLPPPQFLKFLDQTTKKPID